jgi:C-terminal processing protease CtpA/Prc
LRLLIKPGTDALSFLHQVERLHHDTQHFEYTSTSRILEPGEKAGLRTGDVIVEVAGRKIKDLQEVQDILRLFQVGEKVQVGLIRQGKRAATTLVLEEAIRQKSEIF